ncbi:RNA polymerase sigma factor [Carboxylicivirga marina]|uniref:RNA polymerase sigma factor n=1 Tax=Carboxylicivirga marina TaxID=2800988 RepID=UPI002592BD3A|nr:RNA polymerase sigma factor [uncultured Carboxylicivirga sp.]
MNKTFDLTEQLVQSCIHGDERARYEIYQQFVKPMYNVAYRIVANQFDAEDVVQDAFIKAFKKIGSLKDNRAFASWLKQIVVNEAISLIRKTKKMHLLAEDIEQITDVEVKEVSDDIPIEKVMKTIQELPHGARIVFTLRAIEGYRLNEVSELTGQTVNNCKVQYHRARKILSSKLKTILYA